jgi:hypothetical protein
MAKGGALPGFFAAGGRRFRAGGSSRYDRRRYASAYQDASAQDGPGCVLHHHPLVHVLNFSFIALTIVGASRGWRESSV